MVIAGEESDAKDHQRRDRWSDDGNEFHGAAQRPQNNGVGHAQNFKHHDVDHQRDDRQRELRADVRGEHLAYVFADAS